MSQLLIYRLLALIFTLLFVSTFYVVTVQDDVIEQQKQTIRSMSSNPACLMPRQRTFDGDPYVNPAPALRKTKD